MLPPSSTLIVTFSSLYSSCFDTQRMPSQIFSHIKTQDFDAGAALCSRGTGAVAFSGSGCIAEVAEAADVGSGLGEAAKDEGFGDKGRGRGGGRCAAAATGTVEGMIADDGGAAAPEVIMGFVGEDCAREGRVPRRGLDAYVDGAALDSEDVCDAEPCKPAETSASGKKSALSSSTTSLLLNSKIAASLLASKLRRGRGGGAVRTASVDTFEEWANTSEAIARPKSPVALLECAKDCITAAASCATLTVS
jgi:hypothetical protein